MERVCGRRFRNPSDATVYVFPGATSYRAARAAGCPLPPRSCDMALMIRPRCRAPLACFSLLLGCILGIGCRPEAPSPQVVARVGEQHLTQAEVTRQLQGLQLGRDTAQAREQLIEQWITNALLLQEAERRGLEDEPDVQALLAAQKQAVLVNELTNRLYADIDPTITEADVRAYYEQHREQLRLREPRVRVRYLTTETLSDAETVQRALRTGAVSDSTDWNVLSSRHALHPRRARHIDARYYTIGQVFGNQPVLREQLERLAPGETAPIFEIDGRYHVLHLVDRAPEGARPRLAWVEAEIRRRLELRARKQMYAREVERLRNEALARDELDIFQ